MLLVGHEVQTVADVQLTQFEGHVTQLLLFDKKLEDPQLRQTPGLYLRQVEQAEKHLVHVFVFKMLTYPLLQPSLSHLPAPLSPHF
jgi:hypothetical protein